MAISEATLKPAEKIYNVLLSKQCPGSPGFQILLRGVQLNMAMKKDMA